MFLSFKIFIAATSALLLVPSDGHQFQPRQLLTTKQLSNGADLDVSINFPMDGMDIPVDENSCKANIQVSATASVGSGEPNVTYIYVIDDSGSTSNILNDIKAFFISLNGAILSNISTKNVGVITFDSSATVRSGLTRTPSTINNAINDASVGGGTSCSSGLNEARKMAAQTTAGGAVVVIFAGDGACADPSPTATAADELARAGVVIQVLAIGSGVSCSSGSLGNIPRNGGTCQDIENIAEFPITNLVGTKLIEGEAPQGVITAFGNTAFTGGAKSENFTGSASFDKGSNQKICARARGDDVLPEPPQDTEKCITVNVVDNQNPTIDCPANATVGNDRGECSAVYSYEAPKGDDNCPGASTMQTMGYSSGDPFPVSDTQNTFEVTDAEGAVASCTFHVTVEDREKPTIICPANVEVDNDQGECSAVYSYDTPVGKDNCAGASTMQTMGFSSGETFPVSDTQNVFEVTDASGAVASCNFQVTVKDREDPTIICPANAIVGNDPGECSAVYYYDTPEGEDNCAGASTMQTIGFSSGEAFPVSDTKNVFEVTDASGAVASCNFQVTVKDREDPTIICPANAVVGNDPGECSAVYYYDTPEGEDNCAGASTIQTTGFSSGDPFPVSDTQNTFEVTDSEGAIASCNFHVTVEDREKPTITCPANVQVDNDPGKCSAFVAYLEPTGVDNCPGAITSQIGGIGSGGNFPVDHETKNTFEATDAVGRTDECSFVVTVQDTELPIAYCTPSVNPAGNQPKANNQDGFFELGGQDNCGVDTIYVVDSVSGHKFGPFPSGTIFKYVEAPGAKIKQQRGPGQVDWKLIGNGDAYVLVTDIHGNIHTAECLVPPYPDRRLRRGY